MNNNKRINLMQGFLRAGVCLFMLSGTCVLSAQKKTEPAKETPKKEQKSKKQQ